MSRSRLKRIVATFAFVLFLAGLAWAQQASEQTAANTNANSAADAESNNANAGVAEILTATTEKAAKTAEGWGHRLGLGKDASFGISVGANFAGIVLFCWVLLKARLPQAYRERTATIQKGIREAQAASADASRRLTEIESRLSKLDSEVTEIRQSADREAATEEERIREAAEQDKRKIVEGAEAEIEAIARNARRELKSYAASLAVDLATRGIHVDEGTDHALVSEFVNQLGKDSQ
jgi:F-type H+-transporting ATPase subunit b